MPVTTATESSVEPSSTTISSQSWWRCACTDSMAARTTVARFHSGITMLTSGWPSAPVNGGPWAVRRSAGRSGVVRGACRQPISLRQRFTAAVLAAYTSPRVIVGAPGAAGSTDSGVGGLEPPHQWAEPGVLELGMRRDHRVQVDQWVRRGLLADPRVVEVPEQRVAAARRTPEPGVEVLGEEQRMR